MRLRTWALALALSFGVTGVASTAGAKQTVRHTRRQNAKKYKQSKAAKVRPRRAKKVTSYRHRQTG